MATIQNIMTMAPVIPVVSIERAEDAVPLAKALLAGGLPVIEITLRTPAALDAITAIASDVPKAVVGVGTVIRGEEFAQARAAGARFAVSPGLTPALLEAAADDDALPFLPGVMTPGEVIQAQAAGLSALKLFPAGPAGGVDLLRALAAPFPGVQFCPTGGVSLANLNHYLALPNVRCVGGSWVAPADAIAGADWQRIRDLASEAAAAANDSAPADASFSSVGEEDPGSGEVFNN